MSVCFTYCFKLIVCSFVNVAIYIYLVQIYIKLFVCTILFNERHNFFNIFAG